MQKFIAIGNVGKIEAEETKDGKPKAKFSLALNEFVGGEKRTTWINCQAAGKSAENMLKIVDKGNKLYIEGKFNQYEYERDGKKQWYTYFFVTDWEKVAGDKKDNGYDADADDGDDFPF